MVVDKIGLGQLPSPLSAFCYMHKPSPLGLPDESSSSVSALVSSCKRLAPSRVLCTFVPMFILGTDIGLAKVAVQSSADSFVVNQSLVLRINICGKNRHLRQAAKRCASA